MRLGTDSSDIRHPLGQALPGVFHDDAVLQQVTAALDQVLAPLLTTVDNLLAWFDPGLTPDDALPWLASWVGVELDEEWSTARQRDAIAGAADLYRWRGTVEGLRREVALLVGVEPEIDESGGVAWSDRPGDPLPGSDEPGITVKLAVPDPDAVDRARLERIIREATPVALPYRLEIVAAGSRKRTEEGSP